LIKNIIYIIKRRIGRRRTKEEEERKRKHIRDYGKQINKRGTNRK